MSTFAGLIILRFLVENTSNYDLLGGAVLLYDHIGALEM